MVAAIIPQGGFGIQISFAGHDIGYLTDVSFSGMSAGSVDVSSHESRLKAFVGGLVDGGELTVPVRFIAGDTTGQKKMYDDIKTQIEREVIITLPDLTTITFDAICTKFGDFTFPVEGSIDAVIAFKVTGGVVISGLV